MVKVSVAKLNIATYERLRDSFNKTADEKLRDRETNTAKKLAQANSARREGLHCRRAATLVDAWIDAAKNGTLPHTLTNTLRKDDFLKATEMVGKRVPNGFHEYLVDGDDYKHHSSLHKDLRALIQLTPEQEAAREEEKARIALAQKIDKLRNCDIPGFFPTPSNVLEGLSLLYGDGSDVKRFLEPSAGLGDIADHFKQLLNPDVIDVVEVWPALREILTDKGYNLVGSDFLELKPSDTGLYDLIVMNPPFEKKQGIKHTIHAMQFLAPDGRVCSLLPPNHIDELIEKIGKVLDQYEIDVFPLPKDSFNSKTAFRRTGVGVSLIRISRMPTDNDNDDTIEAVAHETNSLYVQSSLF